MSDIPPPPGGRHPDPPPPPPPNLSPPPGYVAYDNAPTSGQLSRVGGVSKALTIVVAVVGAAAVLAAVLTAGARDAARDFREGRITETEFLESYLVVGMLGLVQLAATIAAFVLTIIVMYRLAANHRALGRTGTWKPGWAIGGWFLPPLVLYVIPFLMFRELWKASDPDSRIEGDRWKQNPVSPVVTIWWVLYGLVPLALIFLQGAEGMGAGGFASTADALAETIEEQYAVTLVGGVATLAAAIAFIVMIRGLVVRHRQLTGES